MKLANGRFLTVRYSRQRPLFEARAALECKVASMLINPNKDSSGTLMMRIQEDPADHCAWDEFVELYQPMIRAWCLRWGSQPADAEDIAQQVLLKLLTAMKNYRRQAGSGFRCWLKTVTHNAWLDFVTARRNSAQYPGSIDSITDSNDALADLETQMQRAFENELLAMAMHRVKPRLKPSTWEAFRLTAIENLQGVEAAARLDMDVSNVFVHKHRVMKLLEAEVRILKIERG
jgi:RNA polymerase sigma factor (sigma-70 family)